MKMRRTRKCKRWVSVLRGKTRSVKWKSFAECPGLRAAHQTTSLMSGMLFGVKPTDAIALPGRRCLAGAGAWIPRACEGANESRFTVAS
jgi:hypothetical protein